MKSIFQGTVIVTGLQSANLDTSKFDDPNRFNPERFLDEKGVLCLKKDVSMPFGAGKHNTNYSTYYTLKYISLCRKKALCW